MIYYEKNQNNLYRNPRNTDWSIFLKTLQPKLKKMQNTHKISTADELDTAVQRLTKALNYAHACASPGRLNAPKRNQWWNKELQKLKLETRRLYRIDRASKGTPTEEECWLALRKCRNSYTKEIRRAQTGAWTKFCGSIEGASATSGMHRLLAKDPSKGPGILKDQNGKYTSSNAEVAKLLLVTHFPGNVDLPVE